MLQLETQQTQQRTRTEAEELKRAFCNVMASAARDIPHNPVQKDILEIKPAIPHIAEAAQYLTDWLADKDLIWPFTGLGRFYSGQGLYHQAEPWFEQCLAISQSCLGSADPDVAASLNNLAGLYRSQGRYDQAEPLYSEALEIQKQLLGSADPDVALSLNNLAVLYDSQGRYDQAEPLYIEALEMSKQLLGSAHPDVANSLNNLAELYRSQGRYNQAESLCTEALEMRKQLLGSAHPDVATSLNNLASLYYSQGRYDQAEPLYTEALEMSKQLLGSAHLGSAHLESAHPDVAQILNNLAELYRFQGRYDQAESRFEWKKLFIENIGLVLIVGIAHSRAFIQHFALRLVLSWNGYAPWNYAKFLDYATKRLLMQRVGGGYRFLHDLLRQHFAKHYS